MKKEKKDNKKSSELKDKNNIKDKDNKLDPLILLQEKLDEVKDRNIRLLAEMANLRKRHESQREQWVKYAHSNLALDLLNIIDNLERATQSKIQKDFDVSFYKNLLKGVKLSHKDFIKVLGKYGITAVIPKKGKAFDSELHEAISVHETNAYPEGSIWKVVQAGYSIHSRLLRPASVITTKTKEKNK